MDGLLRVTEILKPFAGYGHIPQDILDNAAARGTMVHQYCNAIVQGFPDIETVILDETDPFYEDKKKRLDQAKLYVNSFRKWEPEKKTIFFPSRFNDTDLGITGECDGLWKDKEMGWILFDLKTSCKEGKTWPLQIAAYRYLAEKAGYKIDNQIAIHLFKNEKKPGIYEYEYERNLDLFFACLKAYKAFFRGDKYFEAEDFL